MMLKTAVLFLHLIAMAVAVGKILEFDLRFLPQAQAPLTREGTASLKLTKAIVAASLSVLWLTGATLILLGMQESPAYLQNEKLWVKVLIVVALTVNGWVMHRWAFPVMQGDTAFLELAMPRMLGLAALAVTSSVSWMYASFLGIARSWNHTVSFAYPIAVYAVLLMAGWAAASAVLLWLRQSRAHSSRKPQRSPCPQS